MSQGVLQLVDQSDLQLTPCMFLTPLGFNLG